MIYRSQNITGIIIPRQDCRAQIQSDPPDKWIRKMLRTPPWRTLPCSDRTCSSRFPNVPRKYRLASRQCRRDAARVSSIRSILFGTAKRRDLNENKNINSRGGSKGGDGLIGPPASGVRFLTKYVLYTNNSPIIYYFYK